MRGGLTLSYSGYGTARACRDSADWTWRLSPARPAGPSETQRRPASHPWEAGWLIWRYTDERHFYYLILKPNGFEAGKEDPAYPGGQRFLITRPFPRYDVADWHDVEVRQTANTIAVTVDGDDRATTRDQERPYLRGDVGLYTEDAVAHFTALRVRPLPAR